MKTIKGIIWFEDCYTVDHRGKHGLVSIELFGEALAGHGAQVPQPPDADSIVPYLRSALREVELKLTPRHQDLKVSCIGQQVGDLIWKARKAVDCVNEAHEPVFPVRVVGPAQQAIVRDLCDAIALLNNRLEKGK